MKLINDEKLRVKALTKKDGIYTAFGHYYLVINHRMYAFTERSYSGEGDTFVCYVDVLLNYGGFNVVAGKRVLGTGEQYESYDLVAKELLKTLWQSLKK